MQWFWLATVLFFSILVGPIRGDEGVPETPAEVQDQTTVDSANRGGLYPTTLESETTAGVMLPAARTGYFHPFLSVNGFYTDNLYHTAADEAWDRILVVSPGLWLALPPSNQRQPINTLNTAAGGLTLSRAMLEEDKRHFQGYAFYRADIREYEVHRSEDRIDQRAEGRAKLQLQGGLSLEVAELFERKSDPYAGGEAGVRNLPIYDANLVNAIVAWRSSPKLLTRVDYGHYRLSYDDEQNAFRNRNDDIYSAYLYFQVAPKCAVFVQGEYLSIDFDKADSVDNQEKNAYLGFQAAMGGKTHGRIKLGYGRQEYERQDLAGRNTLLAEAELDYIVTPKTSFYLQMTRQVLEPDEAGAYAILAHRSLLGYRQNFSSKWQGDASIFFNRSNYQELATRDARASERFDDEYGGVMVLGFSPLVWMNLNLGYEYRERDSNFDDEDFRNNTFFVRLAAAL